MYRTAAGVCMMAFGLFACSDYEYRALNNPDVPPGEPDVVTDPNGSHTPDTCECPEGFEIAAGGEHCEMVETVPATPTGEVVEVCPIEPYRWYGMYGALYPGGTKVKDAYWGNGDAARVGRLNEVGVWGCDAAQDSAGTDPMGEWIGFTVCLDIDDPGDFLVGLAGDNKVRMHVNGVKYLEQEGEKVENFKYWHILPVSLEPGEHRIDVEGYNYHGIAAFGAEVAGPFPEGSMRSDEAMVNSDYASNIVWSTSDAVGNAFPVGESVSWTCPDGSILKGCEEPVCERVVETPCL